MLYQEPSSSSVETYPIHEFRELCAVQQESRIKNCIIPQDKSICIVQFNRLGDSRNRSRFRISSFAIALTLLDVINTRLFYFRIYPLTTVEKWRPYNGGISAINGSFHLHLSIITLLTWLLTSVLCSLHIPRLFPQTVVILCSVTFPSRRAFSRRNHIIIDYPTINI